MDSRRFDDERASERPGHPADHRGLDWGPIIGLALCALSIVIALLLVAVGVSAFVGEHWSRVQPS